MQHLDTNIQTKNTLDRQLIESLAARQRPKTKAERQKPIYYSMLLIGFFCQVVSFVLASSGVLHLLVTNFKSSTGWILVLLGVFLLGIVEYLVFVMLREFHAERLDDKQVNRSTILLLGLAFCVSTPLTFIGTPYAVSLFASAPVLVDLGEIETKYNLVTTSDSMYIANQIKEAHLMAESIHDKNNRNGTTRSRAVKTEQAYINQKLELSNTLIDKLEVNKDIKNSALSSAIIKNEVIKQSHDNFCASFGGWLALVTLVAQFVLFGSRWYTESWKRLFVVEGRIKLNNTEVNQTEQNNIIRIQTKPNKTEQSEQPKKQAVAKRNPIKLGNEQHGKVFTPQGARKPKISYLKDDGSYTAYTKAELIRMSNRTGITDDYKGKLTELLTQFEKV